MARPSLSISAQQRLVSACWVRSTRIPSRASTNLASLYKEQGRYADAEPLYKRALTANEHTLGPDHPLTLDTANNLAALYQATRRYDEAEQLYKRTLEAKERALGAEHPQTLSIVDKLATLYGEQGRFGDAEPFQRRALEARERILGPDHPQTLKSVDNLAALRFKQQDWLSAAALWRRSTAAIAARTLRGAAGQSGRPRRQGERRGGSGELAIPGPPEDSLSLDAPRRHAGSRSLARNVPDRAMGAKLRGSAVADAEWRRGRAAENPVLAALARERQVLVAEWQKRDSLRSAAFSQAPEKRDAEAEADNIARLAAIDARIKEIDKELAANFPDYAELVSPAPIPSKRFRHCSVTMKRWSCFSIPAN